MGIAAALHVLAVVIWVGGMFFAYVCLRPVAASCLDPPLRLTLWVGVFGRFFPWVWVAVLVVLATGLWMVFAVFGGFANVGAYVHAMFGLGLIMTVIFLYVFFAPYQRLKEAVSAEDWRAGGAQLSQIRVLVGINTTLGIATTSTASGGRYLVGVLGA
jgi:uncharacterized membrane protein